MSSSSSSSMVTASDWMKGIGLSVLASLIGGASKLAIRKSWLMEQEQEAMEQQRQQAAQQQQQQEQRGEEDQQQQQGEEPEEETTPLGTESTHSTGCSTSCDVLSNNNNYRPPPVTVSSLQEDLSTSRPAKEKKNHPSTSANAVVVSSSSSSQPSFTSSTPRGTRYNSIINNNVDSDNIVDDDEDVDHSVDDNNTTSNEYQAFHIETAASPKIMIKRRSRKRGCLSCCRAGPCASCGVRRGQDIDDDEEKAADEDSEEEEEEAEDRLEQEQTTRQPGGGKKTTTRNRVVAAAYTLRGAGMIGMTFLNPLCCVLAMNYASPSILAPFSGLTLVWIIIFSQPCIGEQPTLRQVMAATLIVLGEVVVAIYGDHTNGDDDDGEASLEALRQSYMCLPFLLYLASLIAWMLLLCYWIRNTTTTTTTSPTLKRFSWGVAGGSVTGLQNFLKDSLTIVKILEKQQQQQPKALESSYQEIVSSSSATSSTSISSVQFVVGSTAFPWYLLLLIFLAIATAFGGLLLLTACMKRYDATYSSAMFVGSFVVSATIMSAVHYNTFAHLQNVVNYVLYPAGLVFLMSGIWMLIHEKQEPEENNNNYHRHHGLVPAGGEADEATPSWMTADAATLSSSNGKETMSSSYAACTAAGFAGLTAQGQGGLILALDDDDQCRSEDRFVDEDDRSISSRPRRKENGMC